MSDTAEHHCTPEFSREAAQVLRSPYWRTPRIADGQAQVEATEKLRAKQEALRAAVAASRDYSELPPDMKAVYGEAKAAMAGGAK